MSPERSVTNVSERTNHLETLRSVLRSIPTKSKLGDLLCRFSRFITHHLTIRIHAQGDGGVAHQLLCHVESRSHRTEPCSVGMTERMTADVADSRGLGSAHQFLSSACVAPRQAPKLEWRGKDPIACFAELT